MIINTSAQPSPDWKLALPRDEATALKPATIAFLTLAFRFLKRPDGLSSNMGRQKTQKSANFSGFSLYKRVLSPV
jgi:hypothetical protein